MTNGTHSEHKQWLPLSTSNENKNHSDQLSAILSSQLLCNVIDRLQGCSRGFLGMK